MKIKLEIEVECNGGMQYKDMRKLLEAFSYSLESQMELSDYNSVKNIITNKVTESGFSEEILEKDAAIFLDMSYKNLRSFRQRGLTPETFKKGKSFYYHKKDLAPYEGICQFKIQSMWEKGETLT